MVHLQIKYAQNAELNRFLNLITQNFFHRGIEMIYTSPNGYKIRVIKTNWFTFGFPAYFNGFWISIREMDEALIKHELTHLDQMKKVGFFKFLRMLFDMDYLIKNEIEAYQADGRYNILTIATILSTKYSVNPLGRVFGWRTKPYSRFEVLSLFY